MTRTLRGRRWTTPTAPDSYRTEGLDDVRAIQGSRQAASTRGRRAVASKGFQDWWRVTRSQQASTRSDTPVHRIADDNAEVPLPRLRDLDVRYGGVSVLCSS